MGFASGGVAGVGGGEGGVREVIAEIMGESRGQMFRTLAWTDGSEPQSAQFTHNARDVLFFPVYFPTGRNINQLAYNINGTVASAQLRFFLYDYWAPVLAPSPAAYNWPSPKNLLWDSGLLDTSTSGRKTLDVEMVLDPDTMYWFGVGYTDTRPPLLGFPSMGTVVDVLGSNPSDSGMTAMPLIKFGADAAGLAFSGNQLPRAAATRISSSCPRIVYREAL